MPPRPRIRFAVCLGYKRESKTSVRLRRARRLPAVLHVDADSIHPKENVLIVGTANELVPAYKPKAERQQKEG